jgi:hypothetical protein
MTKLIITVIILTVTGTYFWVSPRRLNGTQKPTVERKLEGEITHDEAIKIAQQHAAKTNIDPATYSAIGCETPLGWRVYLEPTANQSPNEVLEYVLTRKRGAVVMTNKLSGLRNDGRRKSVDSVPGMLSEADAVAIAKRDAARVYDLSNKRLIVCEMKSFWRIIYALPVQVTGGGPEYLIDKKTGLITDKKYYQ